MPSNVSALLRPAPSRNSICFGLTSESCREWLAAPPLRRGYTVIPVYQVFRPQASIWPLILRARWTTSADMVAITGHGTC